MRKIHLPNTVLSQLRAGRPRPRRAFPPRRTSLKAVPSVSAFPPLRGARASEGQPLGVDDETCSFPFALSHICAVMCAARAWAYDCEVHLLIAACHHSCRRSARSCQLLGAVDVLANMTIVQAFQYTSITSVTLLDSARQVQGSILRCRQPDCVSLCFGPISGKTDTFPTPTSLRRPQTRCPFSCNHAAFQWRWAFRPCCSE